MKPPKLIFILGIIFLSVIIGCNKREPSRVSKSRIPPKPTAEELENKEADYLLQELKQKNPFRPDHAVGNIAVEGGSENVLKGIIWDSQKPFAIIGDSVVMEGDYVDNKKVIKIDKDAVILDNNGKEEILGLEVTP